MEVELYCSTERNIKNWMEDYLNGREMRTVGKDENSEWREVKSGVAQILAHIMFWVYINDMTEGVSSYISLFADPNYRGRYETTRIAWSYRMTFTRYMNGVRHG